MRYLEDVVVGTKFATEDSYLLTEEEIIDYCTKWDPLPFHLDPEAAAKTPMGKLFTSALHTMAISSRMIHALNREPMAVIAGLGMDEVRMLAPACVGDRLQVRAEIVEARASKSDPNRGVVGYAIEVFNQDDKPVLRYKSAIMVWQRGAPGAP